MSHQRQLTGMRGVYLVAAELSRLGLITSPTSRGAKGADLLATDQLCQNAFSVQVKTNARTFGFWLLSKSSAEDQVSKDHVYVLVNIRSPKAGEYYEFFIVPSKIVASRMIHSQSMNGNWYAVQKQDVEKYQDKWSLFGIET